MKKIMKRLSLSIPTQKREKLDSYSVNLSNDRDNVNNINSFLRLYETLLILKQSHVKSGFSFLGDLKAFVTKSVNVSDELISHCYGKESH